MSADMHVHSVMIDQCFVRCCQLLSATILADATNHCTAMLMEVVSLAQKASYINLSTVPEQIFTVTLSV